MSFLEILEEIRQKPKSYRYKLLVVSSVLIMAFIVTIWVTLFFLLPNLEIESKSVSSFGPFSVLKDTIFNIYNAIKR
jgi:hypothetical protein